jgi:hypothetical protein
LLGGRRISQFRAYLTAQRLTIPKPLVSAQCFATPDNHPWSKHDTRTLCFTSADKFTATYNITATLNFSISECQFSTIRVPPADKFTATYNITATFNFTQTFLISGSDKDIATNQIAATDDYSISECKSSTIHVPPTIR